MSGGAVSDRILGYQPWIHEDPALTGLDDRWRVMDAFGDYRYAFFAASALALVALAVLSMARVPTRAVAKT